MDLDGRLFPSDQAVFFFQQGSIGRLCLVLRLRSKLPTYQPFQSHDQERCSCDCQPVMELPGIFLRKDLEFLLEHEAAVRAARRLPWPRLQRILIQDGAADLPTYGRAVAEVLDGHTADIDFAAGWLAQPPAQLNPPPLITGDDLRRAGIPPGPAYKRILDAVRDAQLEGHLQSSREALEQARKLSGGE